MAHLSFKNICKVYPGGVPAVTDFNLEIEDKEFIIFVGPSGCGKSTMLRMIAGLEDITSGNFWMDGRQMNETLPKARDVSMVFQNYALYPHMTVYDNMAFGLKIRKTPKAEIAQKIQNAAEILKIDNLLLRKPGHLSGGQRQRVAIGRAMVRQPKVFLMDEPLSNLDAKLRQEMRLEIAALHKRLQTTFIYVTHDQVEAMTLGSRIVVMKDGFIQQVDTPYEIYHHPGNKFVAGFMGAPPMNFFPATVNEEAGSGFLWLNGHKICLEKKQWEGLKNSGYEGKEVHLGIRPEHLYLSGDYDSLQAQVEGKDSLGAETIVYGSIKGRTFAIKVQQHIAEFSDCISFKMDVSHFHFFDPYTEKVIKIA